MEQKYKMCCVKVLNNTMQIKTQWCRIMITIKCNAYFPLAFRRFTLYVSSITNAIFIIYLLYQFTFRHNRKSNLHTFQYSTLCDTIGIFYAGSIFFIHVILKSIQVLTKLHIHYFNNYLLKILPEEIVTYQSDIFIRFPDNLIKLIMNVI